MLARCTTDAPADPLFTRRESGDHPLVTRLIASRPRMEPAAASSARPWRSGWGCAVPGPCDSARRRGPRRGFVRRRRGSRREGRRRLARTGAYRVRGRRHRRADAAPRRGAVRGRLQASNGRGVAPAGRHRRRRDPNGVQIQDSALYHVVLDSTSIELDACVEIIVRATESLAQAAAHTSANGSAS
jgi:hypothetical protein